MSDNKLPVLRLEDFPVKLAVWENQQDKFVSYSAKIQRSFKDRDGHWQSTDYLQDGDWPKAAALLMEAWRRLRVKDSVPSRSSAGPESAPSGVPQEAAPF